MAEINRAEEEITPEDNNSESWEKLILQEEKGAEFNYEQRKTEIEARFKERTEGSPKDPESSENPINPGYKGMIKEIFANKENPKDDGNSLYLKTLLKAREKAEDSKSPGKAARFSREEELALALDKKRKGIEEEMSAAMKKLEQERQEDRKRVIGEI